MLLESVVTCPACGHAARETIPTEIDSNTVERAIRPIALNCKNALFAGHDQGGVHWGVLASLVETCKMNTVDPLAYITDVLTKLVEGWPMNRIDELMPRNCAATRLP